MRKKPALLLLRESQDDEEVGKATQNLKRTCFLSSKDGHFTQKCGARETCSSSGSLIPHSAQGQKDLTLPLNHQRERKGRGEIGPHQ